MAPPTKPATEARIPLSRDFNLGRLLLLTESLPYRLDPPTSWCRSRSASKTPGLG
jgi:hypothetical protein